MDNMDLNRRRALWFTLSTTTALLLPQAACAQQAAAYDLHVSRDIGCGCCGAWVDYMRRMGFHTTLTNEPDMQGLKRRLGVPSDLASCHTAVVQGFVVEGHVPAEDVLRLLRERTSRIRGLAVPGMPLGSPGMETPDNAREPFIVYAFEANGGRQPFARHNAGG